MIIPVQELSLNFKRGDENELEEPKTELQLVLSRDIELNSFLGIEEHIKEIEKNFF